MKTLQTYLIEAVKPPRLSAKNKHLWKDGLVDEDRVIEWLKDNCRVEGSVDIVDGKINVKGGVEVGDHIEEFPYPFGEVTRNFFCYGCKKLKSLKNSPQKVGGYFDCSHCDNLTSLEGAPQEVGGFFMCNGCDNLTSLEGAPEETNNNFECSYCNNLTSLEGAPKKVGRNFNCYNCKNLTSLEGAPKEVVGSFDCYNCGSEFTEEYVKKICNVKGKIRV